MCVRMYVYYLSVLGYCSRTGSPTKAVSFHAFESLFPLELKRENAAFSRNRRATAWKKVFAKNVANIKGKNLFVFLD